MALPTFKDRVVIITDASSSFGQACAHLFTSLKAKLVLNYPSNAPRNENSSITTMESSGNEDKVVEAAYTKYDRVDILIHIVGSPKGSLSAADNGNWTSMVQNNLKAAFKSAKAAWPVFRKQGFGQILLVDSSESIGDIMASASQFAYLGFAQTLIREGAKYNVKVNVLVPQAPYYLSDNRKPSPAGRMDESLHTMTWLLSEENANRVPSSLLVSDGKGIVQMRWERSAGIDLNPDVNFTVDALIRKWKGIYDFSNKNFPDSAMDMKAVLESNKRLPGNEGLDGTRFDGKVVIVTGAAGGLGRCYSLAFASLRACVVVNDLVDPSSVVQKILSTGGKAVGVTANVTDSETIVDAAIRAFGRLDILINNAGFLRDKSFLKIDEAAWDSVVDVHLTGTYRMTKAVWPHFVKQRHGCIVNTTSTSGIYGHFGQTNYSAAKLGIVGITEASAQEGLAYGIRVNSIAPVASTGMFMAVMGEGDKNKQATFQPEYNVPIVLLLSSDTLRGEKNLSTGGLFEVGCGRHCCSRLTKGVTYTFPGGRSFAEPTLSNPQRQGKDGSEIVDKDSATWLEAIQQAKRSDAGRVAYRFTTSDVILYNLSIGAKRSELSFVYESSPSFQALPTFGVIPFFSPQVISHHSSLVPNFSVSGSLLGEHYLEILQQPIPTSGHLVSTRKVIEVLNKGSTAIATTGYTTKDAATSSTLFYNEVTVFMRGAGGFGGPRNPTDRGRPSRVYTIPSSRHPDHVVELKTSEEQAVLYRLTGDIHPMHVDPAFSSRAGFPLPILHGVCSMGIAGRLIYQRYGMFRSIKARFSGTVVPGQTLAVSMWGGLEEMDLVVFRAEVVETGKPCIEWGGVHLVDGRGGCTSRL